MLSWLLFPVSIGGLSFPVLLGLFLKFALVSGSSVGPSSLTASLLLYVLCLPLVIGLFVGGLLMKDFGGMSSIVTYALLQSVGGVMGWWGGKLLSRSLRQKGEKVQ
jgi:hypothetical protein